MRPSRLLLLMLAASLFTCVMAAHAAPRDPSPCIGLVLGGGGARGAAHIGVIQVLEREHIPICRIAGTSMGSIVGGLYAAGYSSDEMSQVIGQLDWKDLFSDDPDRVEEPMRRKDADYRYLLNFEVGYKNGHIVTPAGVVQGQKLLLLLRRLLVSTWNVQDFDALPVPFRAVATDIVAGKPVVFSHGDLPLAIRSSMSVPGAFAPTNVDGKLLVDGGLMDNVPIDVVRGMGADRLIVVDVGSPLAEESTLSNPVALLNQMVSALMAEKTARQLGSLRDTDILITPALGKLGAGEFNRAPEAIAIGRAAAEAALPRLRALTASPQAWQAWEEAHRQRDFDPKLVAFIDVDTKSTKSGKFAANRMQPEVGKPFDVKDVEKRIGTIYGQGGYQQVDYHLVERGEDRGIRLTPVDKSWGPLYGKMGFQLDDDFNGRSEYLISAEITAANLNDSGGESRTTFWSGRIGGARTEFYQPFGQGATAYVMPFAMLRNEDVPVFDGQGDRQLAEYRIRRSVGGFTLGWTPASYWRFQTTVTRGRDNGDLRVGTPSAFPSGTSDFASIRPELDWDSLDNAQFPTRGAHVNLDYESFRSFAGGDVKGDVAHLIADWVPDFGMSTGRYHVLLGLRASSALDNSKFFESQAFLGGFLNLSGYSERSLYGNQMALGRVVVYRRTGNLDALFSTPIFIGMSLEAGNVWQDKGDARLDSVIYAGSIFAGLQSPLGPVFLGLGHAQGGHTSVYLTFGSLLRPRL
ncbi:MAG: patatin-like phospholipase family protein [Luteibacter sp.]